MPALSPFPDVASSRPHRRLRPWPGLARCLALSGLLAALLAPLAACDSARLSTDRPGAGGSAPDAPGPAGRSAVGSSFPAVAGRIHDGDSFDLAGQGGERVGVRLAGIDAPERRQPFADVSRRHLQSLIGAGPITIHVLGYDRYGRILARVERPEREESRDDRGRGGAMADVGLAQVEAGLAWFYRRYERDLPAASRGAYDRAENEARSAGRGLWREPAPVPPWTFRQNRRQATPAE